VTAVLLLAAWLSSQEIESLLQRDVVAGRRICDASRTFYARRHFETAWSDETIAALLRAIDALENDGLNPARYHRDALLRTRGAERDVLATDAFLLAAGHLSSGVMDPEFKRPAWCGAPGAVDLAAVLQSALENGTIEADLPLLAPRHAAYVRLREALAGYREVAERGGWNHVPEGPSLRTGDDDPRVLEIRKRLGLLPDRTRFDEELDAHVRHFQSHHGISEDGVVGRETLREMNVSAADRVRQIAVNLERWRWMPADLGEDAVLVNTAAFRLDVVDDDRSVLTMKTIVGKDYTRTPFFAAHITAVTINPWWNVPDSIAIKELWPKQRRDRSYFSREHMIVSNGRIRQRPGPGNALGRLKFEMPNSYSVYLHDTPSRELFDRTRRAFSHGCIRVERPLALALQMLRDQPEWTAEAIETAIVAGQEILIPLKEPRPVYVLYWTAWVGDDGHMEFHQDHYERDLAIAKRLW
jgi:murein L,D-transpeptidase YcbB/YkuD